MRTLQEKFEDLIRNKTLVCKDPAKLDAALEEAIKEAHLRRKCDTAGASSAPATSALDLIEDCCTF